MSDEVDISNAPKAPPEVEQAAMLGNEKDAVNLYIKFFAVDEATAKAVVAKLAE